MNSDRKALARINVTTAADNTIIAAPSTGHIEIDHISVLVSGGANNLTFKNGSTTLFNFDLVNDAGWAFDNSFKNPIELSEATAFILNLGSATQVDGLVLYRVVGE